MDAQLVPLSPTAISKRQTGIDAVHQFDTFFRGYLQPTLPAHAHIGSQARFIMPRSGTPPITYLFRYENQARLRAFLEHRLETRIEVPQHNASPQTELNLSAAVARDLEEKHQADFNLWHSLG